MKIFWVAFESGCNLEGERLEQNHYFLRAAVRYGLYPLCWVFLLYGFFLIWTTQIDPSRIWAVTVVALAVMLLLVEWLVPYDPRWSMSVGSFLADMRFAVVNIGLVSAFSVLLSIFTITTSGDLSGPARHWNPALQLLAALLIAEAVNYVLHRAMHEMRGPFGRFMWLIHAAHHLPPRVYITMHAVSHPLNGIINQVLAITLPIWLMGYDQRVVTMLLMIINMQTIISHFNVDVRMGWLNYIFVGPELHRYHHSANVDEARNYCITLSLYDWLFGTFVYRPGVPPAELGVDPSQGLPAYERTLSVLALPFR